MFDVSISRSAGTKAVYACIGYGGKGLIVGFNSKWGGYAAWVQRSTNKRPAQAR